MAGEVVGYEDAVEELGVGDAAAHLVSTVSGAGGAADDHWLRRGDRRADEDLAGFGAVDPEADFAFGAVPGAGEVGPLVGDRWGGGAEVEAAPWSMRTLTVMHHRVPPSVRSWSRNGLHWLPSRRWR